MFKLNELKRTFIKNNRKRRDLNAYFNNFADKGRVGIEEMKRIVREYGYDITDDEAKILFRLSGTKEESLAIDQFVELMTKENVHFKTLKIDGTFGRARKNFDEKIHLVLKNKFNLLK
jgi:Ca2+-binding EF-hand superfamily protein